MEFMKNINNDKFFSIFGLVFVTLGWLGLLLTFAGFFHIFILAVFLVFSFSLLFYIAISNRKNLNLNWDFLLVIFSSIFIIAILAYFTAPTVFSGRDQGSFSNTAIILSQNHQLETSFPAQKEFFRLYGPGTALNFPGFSYTDNGDLITHFPLGYISWLAIFYSLFGIAGLIIANGITFFIFLLSFYLVSKNYLKPIPALIAFFLVLTSFVFSWFFKFTLSENLALALVWFGISQLLFFLKEKNQFFLISFFASFGLLLFSRIETIAFLPLAILVIILSHKSEKKEVRKSLIGQLFIFSGIILFFFAISFKINQAFFINFAKGFLGSFEFQQNIQTGFASSFWENIFYVFRVFSAYSLSAYVILGLIGLVYFLKKRKFKLLIPYFILLPIFFYLLNPSITPDHPWMLRRYLFAVIPVSILYTIIFLDFLFKNKIFFYLISSFLLIANLLTFIPYLGVRENKNLLPQIEKISLDFKKDDLILVDRNATGNPWSMMAGPMNLLFGKQAVYFFNPADLEKLDLTKFAGIYFIIPDNNIEFYEKSGLLKKLSIIKDYAIENQSLEILTGKKELLYKNRVSLPSYQKKYTYGKIYLLNKD